MAKEKSKNKSQPLQAPKGTFDILPQDQNYWNRFNNVAKNIALFHGFNKIETPIFEQTDLFLRSVGEGSDIVEKQMYSFRTKGGDALTLRPEGTSCVVRSYIEHGMQNLPQPVKFYYEGQFFRHERPQRGRYRQFHQFGLEIIGDQYPVHDVEIIQVIFNIFKDLGLKDIYVEINSIGCKHCRPRYRSNLISYYKNKVQKLCKDCRRRFKENPLRLLDCKEEKCITVRANAPQIVDFLCDECKKHLKGVLEFLDELQVPYILNPYLVRGLDYYTKTVFEMFADGEVMKERLKFISGESGSTAEISGKENKENKFDLAIASGGRYDDLAKLLGGRPTPAVGAAIGIERAIGLMKFKNVKVPAPHAPEVFLVQLGDLAKKKSLKLFNDFRKEGIDISALFGKDSITAQLKITDKLKVKYALILGQKEALADEIILRDMSSGVQETIPLSKIIDRLKKLRKR